ncbi:hypothetical protein AHAS_Ahas13G0211900 [Arachis hypogaea]
MRRCLGWLYFIEDSTNETSSLSTNGKLHLVYSFFLRQGCLLGTDNDEDTI